jgi:Domain of unknown function (DUF397)
MTEAHTSAGDPVSAPAVKWRVSSWCASGECIAVAQLPAGQVAIRDTKDPEGTELRFSASEWQAFVQGVRSGEFDA